MKPMPFHLSLKSYRLLRTLSAAALALGLLVSATTMASAAIRAVPGEYSTIQAAINAAVSGDTVLVAPGEYTALNLNPQGKAITIKSQNGPQTCILNGLESGQGFIIQSGETNETRISGFTIYGCSANQGGGIYISGSSPTITNCLFEYNTTLGNGAGLFAWNNSSPIISNCTFLGNIASSDNGGFGGGIYLWTGKAKVSNCVFDQNLAADWGGAALVQADQSVFTNCTFLNNTSVIPGYGGGAVYASLSSQAVFKGCDFENNIGDNGGGILALFQAAPTLINCTFTANFARIDGGALFLGSAVSSKFVNTGFSLNVAESRGGAVVIQGGASHFTNCLLDSNTAAIGGAIYLDSASPTFAGCEFDNNAANSSNNTDGGGAICIVSNNAPSAPTLTGCSFFNNFGWYGGGIVATGNLTLKNCQFLSSNEAGRRVSSTGGFGGSVALLGGKGIFVNDLFSSGYTATGGGALYFDGSATTGTVTNCTLYNNQTFHLVGNSQVEGQGRAILASDSATVSLYNTIVWDSAAGNELVALNGAAITAIYSDVYGGYTGTGNINADPQFVNVDPNNFAVDDFALQSASPCLETGNGRVPYFPSTDIAGTPRIKTSPSIGAYEN